MTDVEDILGGGGMYQLGEGGREGWSYNLAMPWVE